MYILPVLGSGADADNGMAHLVTFIHSYKAQLSQNVACILSFYTINPVLLIHHQRAVLGGQIDYICYMKDI
jgi:hypothetical protein